MELEAVKKKNKASLQYFFPQIRFKSKGTCFKDLSRVKYSFKSISPQFHFVIAELASAVKKREIQNIDEEERFKDFLFLV